MVTTSLALFRITPPIWLDEHGQRRPTRQCPKCGREDLVLRLRYKQARFEPVGPVFCGRIHEGEGFISYFWKFWPA